MASRGDVVSVTINVSISATLPYETTTWIGADVHLQCALGLQKAVAAPAVVVPPHVPSPARPLSIPFAVPYAPSTTVDGILNVACNASLSQTINITRYDGLSDLRQIASMTASINTSAALLSLAANATIPQTFACVTALISFANDVPLRSCLMDSAWSVPLEYCRPLSSAECAQMYSGTRDYYSATFMHCESVPQAEEDVFPAPITGAPSPSRRRLNYSFTSLPPTCRSLRCHKCPT
jgi:hypothetical protein